LRRSDRYRARPLSFAPRVSCRGFTLLEIILAIALIGAVTAVVFVVLSRSLRAAALTEGKTTAMLLAQARLATLLDSPLVPKEQEEVFDPPFDRFFWRVEAGTPLSEDLVPVTVTAGDTKDPPGRSSAFFTYYYKRAHDEASER